MSLELLKGKKKMSAPCIIYPVKIFFFFLFKVRFYFLVMLGTLTCIFKLDYVPVNFMDAGARVTLPLFCF